jgi:hypothetical protein
MEIFIFITRHKTEYIESRVRSMKYIETYAVIDDLDHPSKRFVSFSDDFMKQIGWTNHMSYADLPVSAWDKATYFAYQSKADYVWFCEDDMFWNKRIIIDSILKECSSKKDDLIAFPLAPSYAGEPLWYHWDKAALLTRDRTKWMSTYNQLCRVSRRVLEEMYKLSIERKRLFFHEVMFATICRLNGFTISYIQDLGLPVHIVNRWRPVMKKKEVEKQIENHKYVLLHPVKYLIEDQQ